MYKFFATAAAILIVAAGTATAGTGSTAQGRDALPWPAIGGHYVQGLKAVELQRQAMARFSATSTPTAAASNAFDWGDAGIGAAAGLVLAVIAGTAIVFVRNSRRTKLAL